MPPKNHALLSASSANRWLHCPPSARLCEKIQDKGSEYSSEGTAAHALCEYKLLTLLGEEARDPTEDLAWYNAEMELCVNDYAEYVYERVQVVSRYCKPTVLVEQQVDFSRYVPNGFGTTDALIVADKTMYVFDYKHGQGIPVSADHNPQMMCYALGAYELLSDLYDIDEIIMTIFQPRRSNISTFTISVEDLLKWAEEVLSPTACLAYEGKGTYKSGDWCQFCSAKDTCRKRAEANLELAKYEFRDPPLLTDEELTDILSKLDDLTSWANDVKEYALTSAVSGKHWPGFKLVEGRSVRKYTDENAVARTVEAAGYDPYEKKVLGITAMTRMLGGKNQFNELLGDLVSKPPGKPTLVPETDKRQAINSAANDFKEE